MRDYIPYGRQNVDEEDIDAVVKVLRSNWWTQGPTVSQFEEAVASYCGAKYAVAACNATAALHMACLALEVGTNDIVWTSPNTFLASANCARFCGADVDFVDIDPKTYNMSIEKLEEKLLLAKSQGKLPKVVIPVHFSGQSCDMAAIKRLADKYNFSIIEDASHCIGGEYMDEKIGSCRYSDITIFSFHPVKIIATAEGGMALTNSSKLSSRMQLYRSHGMTRDKNIITPPDDAGEWYYEQVALGYNYRITDIQCALGISQLKKIDKFVEERRNIVSKYNELLKDLPLILPQEIGSSNSAWHLYVVQIDPQKTNKTRLEIFNKLKAANIGVNVHYIPVYLQPYYKQLGFVEGYCPNSEVYYSRAITLPLFPGLTDTDIEYIVESLKKAVI